MTCLSVRSIVHGDAQAGGALQISGLRPRQEGRYINAHGAQSTGHCLWRCDDRVLQQTKNALKGPVGFSCQLEPVQTCKVHFDLSDPKNTLLLRSLYEMWILAISHVTARRNTCLTLKHVLKHFIQCGV